MMNKEKILESLEVDKLAVALLKEQFNVTSFSWEQPFLGRPIIEAELFLNDGTTISIKRGGGLSEWKL